jgi:Ran GTPase-activating protein (RanGAP) involved in mRNA processing and transport
LPNALTEINLSKHPKLNLPSELGTSLLNYNINKNLISLNFSECELKESDLRDIANYIVASNSLLVLDIGKNILTPLSCSTLGYGILKTTSLETLKLNECDINEESLLFLFNGKGSKPLKHINLNGNKFGDIGLVSLCSFMKATPLLESIELEHNGGTDMGLKYIVNTIQENENNKMKYVNFRNNNITNISLDLLKKSNDYFTKKKVIFGIDKITSNNYDDITCVMFS